MLRLYLKRIVFVPLQGLRDPATYQVLSQFQFQRLVIMMGNCFQPHSRVTGLQFLLNPRRERNISKAKNLGTIHCLMIGFLLAFRWRKNIATAMTGFLEQVGKKMLLLPKLLIRLMKTWSGRLQEIVPLFLKLSFCLKSEFFLYHIQYYFSPHIVLFFLSLALGLSLYSTHCSSHSDLYKTWMMSVFLTLIKNYGFHLLNYRLHEFWQLEGFG